VVVNLYFFFSEKNAQNSQKCRTEFVNYMNIGIAVCSSMPPVCLFCTVLFLPLAAIIHSILFIMLPPVGALTSAVIRQQFKTFKMPNC